MPTSEPETKDGTAFVVLACRLEDQQLAEVLTAAITAAWDRLPISDLMNVLHMVSVNSATDMEQAVRLIIESALFGDTESPLSKP